MAQAMATTKGVVYVAYGGGALREARLSIESLKRHHPRLPVVVVSHNHVSFAERIEWPDLGTPGRWAKVNLDKLTPFDHTLFLDADTRVFGKLDVGFDAIAGGYDLVMVASKPQNDRVLWHLGDNERMITLMETQAEPLQLNTGVMWFRKSRRVTQLFAEWRRQWKRWRDKDQGALLRALELRPVSVFLLGWPYNGGAVIEHRFGACAR